MDETFELEQLRVPRWAWLVAGAAALVAYGLALDNGALLGEAAGRVHEFFHDARHFVAVPCH